MPDDGVADTIPSYGALTQDRGNGQQSQTKKKGRSRQVQMYTARVQSPPSPPFPLGLTHPSVANEKKQKTEVKEDKKLDRKLDKERGQELGQGERTAKQEEVGQTAVLTRKQPTIVADGGFRMCVEHL